MLGTTTPSNVPAWLRVSADAPRRQRSVVCEASEHEGIYVPAIAWLKRCRRCRLAVTSPRTSDVSRNRSMLPITTYGGSEHEILDEYGAALGAGLATSPHRGRKARSGAG